MIACACAEDDKIEQEQLLKLGAFFDTQKSVATLGKWHKKTI